MWKKVGIAALTVFVGLLVVSPKVRSVVRVKFNRFVERAEKQIDPETEIAALRLRLQDLAREDRRHYDLVARQEVALEKHQKKVAALKTDVKATETRLKAMKTSLDAAEGQVSWNGSQYTPAYFRDQLRSEFKTFQARERVLQAETRILETMEKTLAVNRQKLGELKLTRTEMEARLVDLERQVAEERLVRDSSLPVLNDAGYSELDADINKVEEKLEVQRRARKLAGQSESTSIKGRDDEKARQDAIDREIAERLGRTAPPVADRR